jgi:transposase
MSGGKNPKRYTPEFKDQAAKMVVDLSRPIAQVARELGVNDTTLGFWVKAYRKQHSGDALPVDMPERARLQELERRNRELEMENAFLKKGVPRTLEAV